MFLANFALIVIMIVAPDWMKRLGFTLDQQDIEPDEDLPNFFNAVNLGQANQIVNADQYLKEKFEFEMNDPDTIARLDATTMPKKSIQGTPWYHILSNKWYVNEFNYIGPHIKEREKLIEDGDPDRFDVGADGNLNTSVLSTECVRDRLEQSDLVMILFALAYLPDEVVQKVDFTQEQWSLKLKEEMIGYKERWAQNRKG